MRKKTLTEVDEGSELKEIPFERPARMPSEIKGCARKGIEFRQWIHTANPWFLRKGDVDSLEEGDTVEVICLDRNVADVTFESNTEMRAYTMRKFFKHNMAVYTHGKKGGASGTIQFSDPLDEPIPFTLHVEYEQGQWYPLSKDGCLPVFDPQIQQLFGNNVRLHGESTPKCWNKFAPTTLVGWRGPMLPVERVKKLQGHMRHVWFDPNWPGRSCATWSNTIQEAMSTYVRPLRGSSVRNSSKRTRDIV